MYLQKGLWIKAAKFSSKKTFSPSKGCGFPVDCYIIQGVLYHPKQGVMRLLEIIVSPSFKNIDSLIKINNSQILKSYPQGKKLRPKR